MPTFHDPVWSPNIGGSLMAKGCVLHATHGRGTTLENEFAGTLAWFRNPTSEVSAHIVIAADGVICEVVPTTRQAWHARSYNATHLGIEFVKRDPGQYHDEITDAQYKSAAWWLVETGIDLIRETLPEHREIQSDKIDIGPGFERSKLMEWIRRFRDA